MFKVLLFVISIIYGFDAQSNDPVYYNNLFRLGGIFYMPPVNPLPIVLWNGMGSTSENMEFLKSFIQQNLGPNAYIIAVRMGKNSAEERTNSYLMHPNKQIEHVCEMIASDEKLKNGYNAIGFSQASQFLRAVAQRCPEPRMNNLISLSGQHQGVYGIPNCPLSIKEWSCNTIRKLLSVGAYWKFVQKRIVQATYWHGPLKEDAYRHKSTFLAELNNEVTINQAYVGNLKRLNKLVLVKFLNDSSVQPIDSQWFQFYTPNQAKVIQEFSQSNAARNLGLNDLLAANKIDFIAVEGDHIEFTLDWFKRTLMPYLNGKI